MGRAARITIPGIPHHIVQRGNNREDVFFSDDDRRVYIRCLREHCGFYGLEVVGFCLMSNHVHLVATPLDEAAPAKALGRTHSQYASYMNERLHRSGHLWQGRFHACPLDGAHAFAALRYTECNPVRAGLVAQAWEYPWSSAAAHVGVGGGRGLLDLAEWWKRRAPDEWREVLRQPMPESDSEQLRVATARGQPVGSDEFVDALELRLGRRLRARPVGRPAGRTRGK